MEVTAGGENEIHLLLDMDTSLKIIGYGVIVVHLWLLESGERFMAST